MKYLELKLSQDMGTERMMKAGFHTLHIDISDGHFVYNLTVGPSVVESLWKRTKANLECNLKVTNPLRYVEPLAKAGASVFTFHIEASKDNWRELICKIKAKGMRPAVALKDETPVEEVFPLVEDDYPIDMVLIMTVERGFGKGESFMPKMLDKVRMLGKKYPKLDIQVDGCVGPCNIKEVTAAGANCIVSGAAMFITDKPREFLACYKTLVIKEIERLNWFAENADRRTTN
ncbi:hypothetical protein MKW98_022520 [Papaver atlanticum]|uniref:ribulose-phosphate 3-epimerase n=1 Tax=Papaver atlanticum TaxID=357466 RepID=A0AAD4SVC7_9MAGN|nr:hypothetical protein MKW98_022520 [Papaver atlanticum]